MKKLWENVKLAIAILFIAFIVLFILSVNIGSIWRWFSSDIERGIIAILGGGFLTWWLFVNLCKCRR